MAVVALAGGVGAGKFLRGLVRAVPPEDVTVVVNTGDDIVLHGLHVSPDIDSVVYWLGGVANRERGWGREDETFRAAGELRAFGAPGSWFNLGDLDLATHLYRTHLLAQGLTLSEATARIAGRFGVAARVLPMTDDPVTTRIDAVDDTGRALDLHFQEYWVERGARDEVKAIRYVGADRATPAPGVLEAIEAAGRVLVCPSNPIASIGPILAVPGIRDAVAARGLDAIGISPIVGGAPLRGMADKLMAAMGFPVTAVGAGQFYRGVLGRWVIDRLDDRHIPEVAQIFPVAGITDTVMTDDEKAESLARFVLDRGVRGGSP